MQRFEELIIKLGELMGLALQADSRQSCRLEFPNEGVTAQIDLDPSGERLLIGATIAELPPGHLRDRVLEHALKVNALPRKPRGILAFSEKNETLILFQYLDFAKITAEELLHFLEHFVEHARLWLEALRESSLPSIEEGPATKSSGMLGLS